MRRFQVTVNGIAYDVTVEETDVAATVPTSIATPVVPVAPVIQKEVPNAPAAVGGEEIKSPMPGTVTKVNVKAGDTVKRGDVLVILEAMKMENDICAPRDARVLAVTVNAGDAVATDAVLLSLA